MEEFVEIAYLDNQFQADLLALELQKRNILFYIQSFFDSAYQTIYQMQKGWGKIEAPAVYKEEIAAILCALNQADGHDHAEGGKR